VKPFAIQEESPHPFPALKNYHTCSQGISFLDFFGWISSQGPVINQGPFLKLRDCTAWHKLIFLLGAYRIKQKNLAARPYIWKMVPPIRVPQMAIDSLLSHSRGKKLRQT